MATKYSIASYDVDTGHKYVQKSYIMDVYPNMVQHLRTAGLWLWGDNYYGQLGNGATSSTFVSSPIQTIASGVEWKQVSLGESHSAAIKHDGTLWMWGRNQYGQLGDGTTLSRSSPVQTVAGGTGWKYVSCSPVNGRSTYAVKHDGSLWTWGNNSSGELGDGTVVSKSSPVQTVATGGVWTSVSAGTYFAAAIKADGTLWTWGANDFGQLGDGTVAYKSSPVQTVAGGNTWSSAAAGQTHLVAIKADGTLWTCGSNWSAQLGDGSIDNAKSSPVQTIAGGITWRQASAGADHTAAVKTDGTLWIWGAAQVALQHSGAILNFSSPTQTIAGGTNWKYVAVGEYHVAAIREEADW